MFRSTIQFFTDQDEPGVLLKSGALKVIKRCVPNRVLLRATCRAIILKVRLGCVYLLVSTVNPSLLGRGCTIQSTFPPPLFSHPLGSHLPQGFWYLPQAKPSPSLLKRGVTLCSVRWLVCLLRLYFVFPQQKRKLTEHKTFAKGVHDISRGDLPSRAAGF